MLLYGLDGEGNKVRGMMRARNVMAVQCEHALQAGRVGRGGGADAAGMPRTGRLFFARRALRPWQHWRSHWPSPRPPTTRLIFPGCTRAALGHTASCLPTKPFCRRRTTSFPRPAPILPSAAPCRATPSGHSAVLLPSISDSPRPTERTVPATRSAYESTCLAHIFHRVRQTKT